MLAVRGAQRQEQQGWGGYVAGVRDRDVALRVRAADGPTDSVDALGLVIVVTSEFELRDEQVVRAVLAEQCVATPGRARVRRVPAPKPLR